MKPISRLLPGVFRKFHPLRYFGNFVDFGCGSHLGNRTLEVGGLAEFCVWWIDLCFGVSLMNAMRVRRGRARENWKVMCVCWAVVQTVGAWSELCASEHMWARMSAGRGRTQLGGAMRAGYRCECSRELDSRMQTNAFCSGGGQAQEKRMSLCWARVNAWSRTHAGRPFLGEGERRERQAIVARCVHWPRGSDVLAKASYVCVGRGKTRRV